jgi:uncharacterized protein (DUF58 family)
MREAVDGTEASESMKATTQKLNSVSVPGSAARVAESESTGKVARRFLQSRDKSAQRVALQPAGTLLSPTVVLAWLLGSLGVAASVAPRLGRGWLWLDLIVAIIALLACYDAVTLWRERNHFVPVLLSPEKELRGREGQSIQIPLALAGVGRHRIPGEVRVAIMPANRESETALRANSDPQRLSLGRPHAAHGESASATSSSIQLWPWTPEIDLLRRGLWPGPRVGIERRSRFGIWRLRQWFDSSVRLRIDADLRPGRREMLCSPIYRALVASRETAWTGHGRDFERLREYQPGDNFSEIAWKSTARRGAPVTRLFQWEQKQEVYFVVDQSRASAQALDAALDSETDVPHTRAPRRLLDLAVETALVGATVALEVGDEFGLVTYAEEPKSWLRAGSGQFQFHQFRDRLLNLEPLPTTADYEALFTNIRLRLRRRAYLVLLADLAERSISDSMCRGIALLRSSHIVLMTSVLPAHALPAFSPGEEPRTDSDVYAALAGEKENQRLGALARQLRQLGTELRFVQPEKFLRTAVEGYLKSKREQRV